MALFSKDLLLELQKSPSPRSANAFGLPGLVIESKCRLWENKVLSRLKQKLLGPFPTSFRKETMRV